MDFTLSRELLDDIQKYNKLYNYLSQTFTKTYFVIGEDKFIIFLHGAKGAIKSVFDIEAPGKKRYFQIDYGKWLNGISKLAFSETISVRLTEKFIKLQIEGMSDTINLGIIPCENESSEAELINNFIEDRKEQEEDCKLQITDEVVKAITSATSLFSPAGQNNSIALTKQHVLYSDRSIVLKAFMKNPLDFGNVDSILLHKYIAGLFVYIYRENPEVTFIDDYSTVCWKDGINTYLVLTSEICEIVIPTEEELKSITPVENYGTLSVSRNSLLNSLNFFNGFYEASVWKPIVFKIEGGKEANLYYRHPTTEITKSLEHAGDIDGEFIVGSDTLLKLVNRAGETEDEATVVEFRYDQTSPGVYCKIGSVYEAVFAKLTE